MHLAADAVHGLHTVQVLLHAGADVRALDGEGRSVLQAAVEYGSEEVVQELLWWKEGECWEPEELVVAARRAAELYAVAVWVVIAGHLASRYSMGVWVQAVADVKPEAAMIFLALVVMALGAKARELEEALAGVAEEREELEDVRKGLQALIMGAAGAVKEAEHRQQHGQSQGGMGWVGLKGAGVRLVTAMALTGVGVLLGSLVTWLVL